MSHPLTDQQLASYLGRWSNDELLLELDRLDCEQSLYTFFTNGWRYIDSAQFVDGMALQAVAEHLEAVARGQIQQLIINIPPRMSKSSMTSVAFPAWVWAQRERGPLSGPQVQFLTASYAFNLALRDSLKCRRLMESPWYQARWAQRFQMMKDQNSKKRYDNTAGGVRLTTSVDSMLTGEGGNIILVDDPNGAQDAESEATIESTIEWWDGALSTRRNNMKTDAFIIIQQRLATNDLTGHILEKSVGEWTHLMLPMRYEPERSVVTSIGWKDWRTEPGELLWEERFGEKEVKALEVTMGPYKAAGQLQQRPTVKGGAIIKRDWWQLWEEDGYPPFDYVVASLDTAYTEKEENDASALTIWGVFNDGEGRNVLTSEGQAIPQINGQRKIMLAAAWQGRLEIHEHEAEETVTEEVDGRLMKMKKIVKKPGLVETVAKLCKRFRVNTLIIENKAAGISVAQELRRLHRNESWTVILKDPKNADKVARAYSVQALFAAGMIYAPDRKWADMVITQCEEFPKGKHDDLVDTVSQALKYLRDIGLASLTQEQDADLIAGAMHRGRPPAPLYPS